MTTPTSLLAEVMHAVMAEVEGRTTSYADMVLFAGRMLATSPALADALALGLAWARVEAALPEGWSLDRVIRGYNSPTETWRAAANRGDGSLHWSDDRVAYSVTPTPAAALSALADALEARAR